LKRISKNLIVSPIHFEEEISINVQLIFSLGLIQVPDLEKVIKFFLKNNVNADLKVIMNNLRQFLSIQLKEEQDN
jgi:hypothetical protein